MARFLFGLLIALALLVGPTAIAHEDPRGDVNPQVVTMGNRFEVYFRSNREDRVYRTIFSADGKLITARESFDGKIPENGNEPSLQMDLKGDRPSFKFTPWDQDQRIVEPQLAPGAYTDCWIIGWLPESKFVMRDSPAKPERGGKWPFSLGIVDLFSGELLASTVIGNPGRIYQFAVTSSVLSGNNDLLIAWMEEKQFPDDKIVLRDGSIGTFKNLAFRVVLTRWQPKARKTLHVIVAPAIDDNVAIGIGRIDNVVLVAWHEFGKIRTRIVDFNTARFSPRLPELRRDEKIEKAVFEEITGVSP